LNIWLLLVVGVGVVIAVAVELVVSEQHPVKRFQAGQLTQLQLALLGQPPPQTPPMGEQEVIHQSLVAL
jgi:hypothetical protein